MFASTMGQAKRESREDGNSVLGILGDLLNRGETLDFTDRSGTYEAEQTPREFKKLKAIQSPRKLSVARPGHEIYTRRARTGYVHTANLGARLDTRG